MAISLEDGARAGQLMGILTGYWRTLAIAAAVETGVLDRLDGAPRPVDDLARDAGVDAGALRRLLRALASLGLVEEPQKGRFGVTALGGLLRREHEASIVPALKLAMADFHWGSWCGLAGALRSGRSAFEERHGEKFFAWLARHVDAGRLFDDWMSRATELQLPAIRAAYDFSWARTVVDVGGGDGTLLRGLLAAHPAMKGILFDMPEVAERACAGGTDMRIVSGDMFQGVPEGGDLYILKTVLHDWHDEACRAILQKCAAAMSPRSRLLIIEMIMPEDGRPSPAYFMDLNMLVLNHGGRERTQSEYSALCSAAGLRIARAVPAAGGLGLLEAVPA